jgi:hypothetical protein
MPENLHKTWLSSYQTLASNADTHTCPVPVEMAEPARQKKPALHEQLGGVATAEPIGQNQPAGQRPAPVALAEPAGQYEPAAHGTATLLVEPSGQ